MEIIQVALRGVQFLWVIILTGLLGNIIATAHNDFLVHPAAVNFSMFVTVLSWLVVLYGLAVAFVDSLAIPLFVLAADALAVVFTFVDSLVLAGLLGAPKCGNFSGNGQEKKCRELQASTAFMWFLFISLLGSLALAFLGWRRGGSASGGRSPTTMKQVHVGA